MCVYMSVLLHPGVKTQQGEKKHPANLTITAILINGSLREYKGNAKENKGNPARAARRKYG